jgi:Tol biopolymer transport system component
MLTARIPDAGTTCCGLLVATVLMASLAIGAQGAQAAQPCKNESIRATQSATFLPDCRAYEMVSPGSNPLLSTSGGPGPERASLNGEGIAYFSRYPAEGVNRSGDYYLATRGEHGWSIEETAPQDSPGAADLFACEQGLYFSPELSAYELSDGWSTEIEGGSGPAEKTYCQSSEEQLAPGTPRGYGNVFVREGFTQPYQLVNVTPATVSPSNARFEDASPDLSHVLFREAASLTPEAPPGVDLYEWAGGAVRLVTFTPGGEPAGGTLADGGSLIGATEGVYNGHGSALASITHAVSTDGEDVFFYMQQEGNVDLYLREHAMQPQSATAGTAVNGEQCTEPGKACTIEIDVTHGSGASGGGVFWDASENASRVFFTDESKLTAGSGSRKGEPDLYEYDVETGALTDLTPEPASGETPDAAGFSGASPEGSYLYFVANSILTGTQTNSDGQEAKRFEPNLYLDHEGTLTFIATLSATSDTDSHVWQEAFNGKETNSGELTAHLSSNGQYLAFSSVESLTGYENEGYSEIYLYGAAANKLVCVSCGRGAERPVGYTELPYPMRFTEKPGGTPVYLSRNVLNDGRVFFTTPNSLVPQDVNGVDDVYEYENGQPHLISTGTSTGGSSFYDAGESGRDVFFVTAQGLVSSDKDNNDTLYDAREGGGFPPAPGEEPVAPECEAEACRPPASEAPAEFSVASSVFSGPGDAVPPPNEAKQPPPEEKKEAKKALTRAQKLARALKACAKRPKRLRKRCRAAARRRFGAAHKATTGRTGHRKTVHGGKGGRR